jgi:hypothetical protein
MDEIQCSVCVMSSDSEDVLSSCSLNAGQRAAWWCPSHHSPCILAMSSKGPTASLRVIWLRNTRATGDMAELKSVKSHILCSNYKYIRPHILYRWRGQFVSHWVCGFVVTRACACLYEALFEFFSGDSLALSWHRSFCSAPLCVCVCVCVWERERERERRKGWVKSTHIRTRTNTQADRERKRERERERPTCEARSTREEGETVNTYKNHTYVYFSTKTVWTVLNGIHTKTTY